MLSVVLKDINFDTKNMSVAFAWRWVIWIYAYSILLLSKISMKIISGIEKQRKQTIQL